MARSYDNAYTRQFRDPIVNRLPEYSAHNYRRTKAQEEASRIAARSAGFNRRTQTGASMSDRFHASLGPPQQLSLHRAPEVMQGSILSRKT